jgi:hypothetical protein
MALDALTDMGFPGILVTILAQRWKFIATDGTNIALVNMAPGWIEDAPVKILIITGCSERSPSRYTSPLRCRWR